MTEHLSIQGRVQGVGYRDAMCREAARLGVTGWVRNRRDGSVEAVVCGADEARHALIEWAHRGPPLARVTSVTVTEAEGKFERLEFRITA